MSQIKASPFGLPGYQDWPEPVQKLLADWMWYYQEGIGYYFVHPTDPWCTVRIVKLDKKRGWRIQTSSLGHLGINQGEVCATDDELIAHFVTFMLTREVLSK